MGFTCKNFMLDPRIVSTGKKVTVIAPNKMSAHEAYNVFLAALSTMGLTVVPKGNMLSHRRVGDREERDGADLQEGRAANQDQMVRYVMRPSYTQTETLRAALDSIRSPAGNVSIAGNVLIITDYASQVRDMLTLAQARSTSPATTRASTRSRSRTPTRRQLATKINEILGVTAGGARGGGGGGGPRGGKAGAPGAAGGDGGERGGRCRRRSSSTTARTR